MIDSSRSRPQLLRDPEPVFLTIESLMYAGRVHCPVLILHGGSDITVPIRSAERIANAIRSSGNSGVTVRIILGVSHTLLPNPFGPNRSWVYLLAFATSPQLLDVMTNWAATHLLIAAGKTCGAEC